MTGIIEVVFDDSRLNDTGWTFDPVIHFSCNFSEGDISEDIPGPIRYPFLCRALRQLVDPEEMQQYAAKTAKKLETILTHAAAGGPVRIWSSNRPGEVCGFYWLMEHLSRLKENCGPVSMIQLPKDAFDKDGTLLGTWGMVYSSQLPDYLPLERPVSPQFMKFCADHWKNLKQENAPLRAVINGCLVSVPETLYDSFIQQEIRRVGDTSKKIEILCNVLVRYQLGIGDQWIAGRMERLMEGEIYER